VPSSRAVYARQCTCVRARAPTHVFCGVGPAPLGAKWVVCRICLCAHAHMLRLAHAHDPPPRPNARLNSTIAAASVDGKTSGDKREASVEKVRFNAETELPSPASFCRGLGIVGCTLLIQHVLDLSHVASGVLIVSAACLIENMDRVRVRARKSESTLPYRAAGWFGSQLYNTRARALSLSRARSLSLTPPLSMIPPPLSLAGWLAGWLASSS